MSNMQEIRNKTEELISLLVLSVKESDKINSELGIIEQRKENTLREIERLEAKIVSLKDINSELNVKLKSDKSEAERLINLNNGLSENLNKLKSDLEDRQKKLELSEKTVAKKISDYDVKDADFRKRESDVVEALNRSKAIMKEANDIKDNYGKKLLELSNREKEINDKLSSVRTKTAESYAMLDEANKKIKIIEDKEKSLNAFQNLLNTKKDEINKKSSELVLKEIEINNIIKDKNINNYVDERNRLEKDRTAFNEYVSKVVSEQEDTKNKENILKSKEEELKSREDAINKKLEDLNSLKKKYDQDIVSLEMEKAAVKNKANELESKNLRLIKIAKEKGLDKEILGKSK